MRLCDGYEAEADMKKITCVLPSPSSTGGFTLLFFCSNTQQAEEWIERPRYLPALPRLANDSAERMEREAALAKSLKLPCNRSKLGRKSTMTSMRNSAALG